MHHVKRFMLLSLVLFLSNCTETTTTNGPVTPPQPTTALINFVAMQSDTSVEALWWIRIHYPPDVPLQTEDYETIMIGEKHSAFHITLDFNKANSELKYPTGQIEYCAVLSGSARNWKTVTVSKGETRTIIVAL